VASYGLNDQGTKVRFPATQKKHCLLVWLIGLLFDPEDRGNTFFRNVGKLLPDDMASYHGRWHSSIFLFSTASRGVAWGPPSFLHNGYRRALARLPACEADRSPVLNDEVKNSRNYTSSPTYVFMAWCLTNQSDVFTFLRLFIYLEITGATTLCGSWPPPWFSGGFITVNVSGVRR
jgi:hypothetical protein